MSSATGRAQGGRLVARALRAQGVDALFTLSGGHVMPIYEGCRHESVRVVDVRHEAAAAHAAEAWGRMRRSCGVAVVTAGPGVTNAVTPVANAFVAHTPLVVVGGARPLVQAETGALQELDGLALMRPITKWAAVCTAADRIPTFLATAFRHALAPPRGPVYLELPMDVLFADGDVDDDTAQPVVARAHPDPDDVARAAALLDAADRPVVVAGSGVWWDGAWDDLRRLAEAARLPVFLNGSARGALPADHELAFRHARGAALAAADVVCVVGTPLDFRLGFGQFGDARLVHVHDDPRELGRNRTPDVALVGDARAALAALADSVETAASEEWLETLRVADRAWWEAHRDVLESDRSPIDHHRLAAEVDRVLPDDATIVGDGGDVVAVAARVLRVRRPGAWLDPGPFGCLGVGPPYAIGASVATGDAPVVVIAGDGAFGLNGLEYDTVVRFGLPVVFVIGNDAQWGEIRHPQVGLYGEDAEVATRLAPSRYDLLAGAFGGHGEHVEDPADLAPALGRALASGGPAIVDVALDPDAMRGHAYRGMG